MPVRDVAEIGRIPGITRVPNVPEFVRGITNLRGEVVTVINLRTILDLPPQEITSHTRLMIVQSEAEAIGVLVDRVSDVATVQRADEEALPANLGGIDSRFFSGMYRIGADLLVVLDIAAALDRIERANDAAKTRSDSRYRPGTPPDSPRRPGRYPGRSIPPHAPAGHRPPG